MKWTEGSPTGKIGKFVVTSDDKVVYPKQRRLRITLPLRTKLEEEANEELDKLSVSFVRRERKIRHYPTEKKLCATCKEHGSGVECHNEDCWQTEYRFHEESTREKDMAYSTPLNVDFCVGDIKELTKALKNAFASLKGVPMPVVETPGWIYTKIRSSLQHNSHASYRLKKLFTMGHSSFNTSLNANERVQYNNLYKRASEQDWDPEKRDACVELDNMQDSLTGALVAVSEATSVVCKSEDVVEKLGEIERSLEGE